MQRGHLENPIRDEVWSIGTALGRQDFGRFVIVTIGSERSAWISRTINMIWKQELEGNGGRRDSGVAVFKNIH